MRKNRIAIAVSIAVAAVFSQGANAQAPAVKNLKLQGSWPASQTIQDHFKGIAERIEKLTGGSIKIETMAAGQVVPPFEVLDATNKKVIDGWHAISYYWVGKNPAAALFAGAAGRPLRHGPHGLPGLAVRRRRPGDVARFLPERAQAERDRRGPRSPPARRPSAGSRSRSRASPTSRA